MTADATKRIPKRLGTDAELIAGLATGDVLVAAAPALATVVVVQTVVVGPVAVFGVPVTIPLAIVGMAVGGVTVSMAPAHVSSLQWIRHLASFYRADRALSHEAAAAHTEFERVCRLRGAVERADGAIVGAVHVDPATMALATEAEWARRTDAFADFCNTVVEFPIQCYSTTRPFPADEHRARYRRRLDDPDVAANPQLRSLLEGYLAWTEDGWRTDQTTIRDHYVIVPVTAESITVERHGFGARLAALPGIGAVVRELTAPPRAAVRAAMLAELDDRLDRVARGLRGIDGVDADRVAHERLPDLLREFWGGHREHGCGYRRTGIVGGRD